MPTCRDMSELVTDYMERTVSLRVRFAMWRHLMQCEACRRYFDQVSRTVRLLGSGPHPEPDRLVEDDVLAATRGEQQRDP